MTSGETALLVLCTTLGALLGFAQTGDAAVGTAAGAAVGLAAGRALQHRGIHH